MNIYVGNLNFKVDENDLEEIFTDFGKVETSKVITDRYTGKSKGFGFVTMENQVEAQNAIEELNGSTYEDRVMVVNEARPKKNNFNR